METISLTDLRSATTAARFRPRAVECQTCGDTGLVAIDGAPPAATFREVPGEYMPCLACRSGDEMAKRYRAEGWL